MIDPFYRSLRNWRCARRIWREFGKQRPRIFPFLLSSGWLELAAIVPVEDSFPRRQTKTSDTNIRRVVAVIKRNPRQKRTCLVDARPATGASFPRAVHPASNWPLSSIPCSPSPPPGFSLLMTRTERRMRQKSATIRFHPRNGNTEAKNKKLLFLFNFVFHLPTSTLIGISLGIFPTRQVGLLNSHRKISSKKAFLTQYSPVGRG